MTRGRRPTVAVPLDAVGESHRQRSKLRVRTTAKSRILDRLTASPEQAIQRRRVGTSQIRRKAKRTMQPGRSRDYGLYRHVGGTHIGRPSTNIDCRAPDVLDHARVDEPTRTESCSASPTSGGRSASTPHMSPPRKIHRSECRIHHRGAWIDCADASLCAACHRMDSWWVAVARCVRLRDRNAGVARPEADQRAGACSVTGCSGAGEFAGTARHERHRDLQFLPGRLLSGELGEDGFSGEPAHGGRILP